MSAKITMLYPLFQNNIPNQSLLALFSILGIRHKNTLASMVEESQKKLLRKKASERWEIDSRLYENQREQILIYLADLGFVNAIVPEPGVYDYAVIFGFVSIDVGNHIYYISQFLKQIQIKQCVLLTSSLPLPECVDNSLGTTEFEAMQKLYQASPLKNHPYIVINVSMIHDLSGTRRPTTDDTVLAWLSTYPNPGKVLSVSGQPFIRRQTRILETLSPKTFSFIPTGPSEEHTFPIVLYLDELARALYQELKYQG